MSEYENIKGNIDKCTAREKYFISIIEQMKEGYDEIKAGILILHHAEYPEEAYSSILGTIEAIISGKLRLLKE